MSASNEPSSNLETIPNTRIRHRQGHMPNTPLTASITSFLLGCIFSAGVIALITRPAWLTYQLGFFLASWAFFHWGEFAVTAGWNREKCSVDSFLLENGAMYHIAHGLAISEYVLTYYFKPSWKEYPYITTFGIAMVITGQMLRSLAMIHASTSFSHMIAYKKLKDHVLITDGIYSWLRHPSYAGFFYWALGTQLVLQNSLTFVVFFALLWRFFSSRIQEEEKLLVQFFGDQYERYRQRTGIMIPFM